MTFRFVLHLLSAYVMAASAVLVISKTGQFSMLYLCVPLVIVNLFFASMFFKHK